MEIGVLEFNYNENFVRIRFVVSLRIIEISIERIDI